MKKLTTIVLAGLLAGCSYFSYYNARRAVFKIGDFTCNVYAYRNENNSQKESAILDLICFEPGTERVYLGRILSDGTGNVAGINYDANPGPRYSNQICDLKDASDNSRFCKAVIEWLNK